MNRSPTETPVQARCRHWLGRVEVPVAVALIGALVSSCGERQTFDIIIERGTVVDGTGSAPFDADIGIRGDSIAGLGDLSGASAPTRIDATGLIVAPGFIDMHAHSDLTLLADGRALSKVTQGVTTEVLGESGSAAPVLATTRAADSARAAALGIRLDWSTFAAYFRRLERGGISVNVLSTVGFGRLRSAIVGDDDRPASEAELAQIVGHVEQAMREGAIGVSTGLVYVPDRYASTAELTAVARGAARHRGRYVTHLRDEADALVASVEEAIAIGRAADLPVHILHFKFSSFRSRRRHRESPLRTAIARINRAREDGVEIHADVYPYVASASTLNLRLPDWAVEGGTDSLMARLRRAGDRVRIREEIRIRMALNIPGGTPSTIQLARTSFGDHLPFLGMTLDSIAAAMAISPADALLSLVEASRGSAGAVYFGIREADLELALRQPWVSIGSDGSALSPDGLLARGHPHPRSYGTFPRVFARYVRERPVLTLAEAVHRMTGLPASQLGLADRGVLAVGRRADVTVFDAPAIRDLATFADPEQLPEGVRHVLVNGIPVVRDGGHTGSLPGRVIRRQDLR